MQKEQGRKDVFSPPSAGHFISTKYKYQSAPRARQVNGAMFTATASYIQESSCGLARCSDGAFSLTSNVQLTCNWQLSRSHAG